MKRFGQIIDEARRGRKSSHGRMTTLDQVAKKIGSHKGYISGIINNKVRPPSPKVVARLCKFLNLDEKEMQVLAWWEKRPKAVTLSAAGNFLDKLNEEILRPSPELDREFSEIEKAAVTG